MYQLDGDAADGAHLARRADHRALHAHRQRDRHHRGASRSVSRQGEDRLEVASSDAVIAQNQWPLFGATGDRGRCLRRHRPLGTTAPASTPTRFSGSFFISLALSWVTAITFDAPALLPLLQSRSPRTSADRDSVRRVLLPGVQEVCSIFSAAVSLRGHPRGRSRRCLSAAVWGFGRVDQNFFPPATRPQFMIDCYPPRRHAHP